MLCSQTHRTPWLRSRNATLTGTGLRQILTVFFGTLVAGSISSQIKVFIAQPGLFLTTLGTAAPLTSIFFLNYVELNVRTACCCTACFAVDLSPERLLCPSLHRSQPCCNKHNR